MFPLDELDENGRARVEYLLARGWAQPDGHALAALDGAPLGEHRLLVLIGPKNNVGSRYYRAYLVDARGRLSDDLLALGLYNTGPFPAYNWIELTRYDRRPEFDGRALDLEEAGLEAPLFERLSALVPPGGHLMVEYDSPSHEATRRVLALGYPPVTSPLGYVLFRAGARSYRDWYIPEGGREGPRKLQAFKPLNAEIAREKTQALAAEARAVIERGETPAHGEWGAIARRNAEAVLRALGG